MSAVATTISVPFLAVVVGTVIVAGIVNGLAGFGFAMIATMVLATSVDPAVAVVFMIIPILGVNLLLLDELSTAELKRCSRRFGPLLTGALVGTVVGLVILEWLPQNPLKIGLGILSLGFVLSTQRVVTISVLGRIKEGCFVETMPAMLGVGAVSGVVFGGTNVGVQFIAYLRSCNLSHESFIGVVAMVFVGLNGVRVGAAGALGLYPTLSFFVFSFLVTIPALLGVLIGKRLRVVVTEKPRRGLVLGLLTLIGIRLLLDGAGVG